MLCPSPFLLGSNPSHQSDQPGFESPYEEHLKLGFIMDQVDQLRQMDVFFPTVRLAKVVNSER